MSAGQPVFSREIVNFTIHGLWPSQNYSLQDPSACTDEAFDVRQISELLPKMEIVWASLWPTNNADEASSSQTKQDESFWSHEWSKHGTCASEYYSMRSQYDFFSTVLDIKFHTPLYQMLATKGIVPSNSKTYTLSQINDALGSFGYEGVIFCQPPPKTRAPGVTLSSPQLLSIELCFFPENGRSVDGSAASSIGGLNHRRCEEAVYTGASGSCEENSIWYPIIEYED